MDIFLPNEREAMAITRQASPLEAAKQLSGTVPLVVVKMGTSGALVSSKERSFTVPVDVIDKPVDTIGAGDSFDGGFIAAWMRDLPLEVCAFIGNACGRANTLARGGIAGQLKQADIPELVGKIG